MSILHSYLPIIEVPTVGPFLRLGVCTILSWGLNFEIILSLYDSSLFGDIRPLMVGNTVELFLRALSYFSMFCRRQTIGATFKKVSVGLLVFHG